MRQTRLSIGCQDWQEITAKIGPAATGVLLYLRLTMRKMQSAEITISTAELAAAMKLDTETVGNLLCMILDAELLDAVPGPDGLTTYQSKEEAAALADRFRKLASAVRRKFSPRPAAVAPETDGNSEYTLFTQNGNSGENKSSTVAVGSASRANEDNIQKEHTTEVMMVYDPKTGGSSEYILSDQTGNSVEKEKSPRTLKKEKSLTEQSGRAHVSTSVQEPELPADRLEAEFIDVCGSWPASLREALKTEPDETREAFYLYIRTRKEQEGNWSADRVRIAWLAARRIPAERRAESILDAAMGGWKTIRDCGSGMYFEKSTGRIVSLVRGSVEPQQTGTRKSNAELAVQLAKNMRRD